MCSLLWAGGWLGWRIIDPSACSPAGLADCACFPDGAERASGAGEPAWVPASGELLGARPACEGGLGGDSASAWRRLGLPTGYPCPGQCPALLPGGSLG